jgi:hypothetical protein
VCETKAPTLEDNGIADPMGHRAACHMIHPGSGHSRAGRTPLRAAAAAPQREREARS